jgi:hypothetical protein
MLSEFLLFMVVLFYLLCYKYTAPDDPLASVCVLRKVKTGAESLKGLKGLKGPKGWRGILPDGK